MKFCPHWSTLRCWKTTLAARTKSSVGHAFLFLHLHVVLLPRYSPAFDNMRPVSKPLPRSCFDAALCLNVVLLVRTYKYH
ncbi:hypothetical protein CPB85DRAFT_960143 [Mucidula mucida]|nr:hypothetical protein CPB85DRAFT_960143 [Mucidula mucida]